jgi:hypothetical protein
MTIILIGMLPTFLKEYNYYTSDVTEWFVVSKFDVFPTTKYGKDTSIVYDREIKKDFFAQWTVVIRQLDETDHTIPIRSTEFCGGFGAQKYPKNNKLPPAVSIVWLTYDSKECVKLKTTPGLYKIDVSWTIDRGPYYYPIEYKITSNIFRILTPEGN